MKHSRIIFPVAAALVIALAGCGNTGSSTSQPVLEGEGQAAPAGATNATAMSQDASWDAQSAVNIQLMSASVTIDGNGAAYGNGIVTIAKSGTYVLSGSLAEGQILVDAAKTDNVTLVLNGASVTCSDGPAVNIQQAEDVTLILADGTENTLTDGEAYTFPDETTDEPYAALYSKSDMVITGDGALTVNGNYRHGIVGKDDLVIAGGNITVTAVENGIRGRDSLSVQGGTLHVTSGNDGLQSNNDADANKGWIVLENCTVTIISQRDAVQSETTLTVNSGEYTFICGGGAANTAIDAAESYKGLKAGAAIVINNGTFTIDSADDAVHSNGNVTINNGTFEISTGDDGFHADEALTVNDGNILIATCYEGLEGSTVTITGGSIDLTASDDGINAAGGSQNGQQGTGRFGQDSFGGNSSYFIRIEGGEIIVRANGDGIDSNGNIDMTGGTLMVHGPIAQMDSAIDCDGVFTFTGGIIAAAGPSGMAQNPGSDSTAPSISIYFTANQQAGTPVYVQDSSGNTIIAFVPERSYNHVILASPDFKMGETYTVHTGGTATGASSGGLAEDCTGGTQLFSFPFESAVVSVSDTGEAVTGGGFGPGGGMRPGGGTRPEGGVMPEGERPNRGNFDPANPPEGFPEGGTALAPPGANTQTT